MENIIIGGEVKVVFTTNNTSYDLKLKELVSTFMAIKSKQFQNDCIQEGLITNTRLEDIDYTVLEEAIETFLNKKINCTIKPEE